MSLQQFAGSNTVFVLSDTHLRRTRNFNAGTPTWESIGPNDTNFRDFVLDPFSPALLGSGKKLKGWLLTDGDLYRSEDLHAPNPTWTPIQQGFANYTLLRASRAEQGSLIAYSNQVAVGSSVFYLGPAMQDLTFSHSGVGWTYDKRLISPVRPNGRMYGVVFTVARGSGGCPELTATAQPDMVPSIWVGGGTDMPSGTYLWGHADAFSALNPGPWTRITSMSGWQHSDESQPGGYAYYSEARWMGFALGGVGYPPSGCSETVTISNIRPIYYGIPPQTGKSKVAYLTNNGDTLAATKEFGEGNLVGNIGLDVSNWPEAKVIHAVGRDGKVYQATFGNGALSDFTPLNMTEQQDYPINGVRIWPARWSTEQIYIENNVQAQLNGHISYLANSSTTALRTENNYTSARGYSPGVAGVHYVAAGPYAYDVMPHNPRFAIFVGYPPDEIANPTTYRVIKVATPASDTTIYSPTSTNKYKMVTYDQYPSEDIYACGPDGVGLSKDGGTTFIAKNDASWPTNGTNTYFKVVPVQDGHIRGICPCADSGSVQNVTTPNPIELRTGTKVISETDLSIQTPVGALAFTRSYIQDELDTLDFMGLGWTHNHHFRLTVSEHAQGSRTAEIRWNNGGVIKFQETALNHFYALAGSNSELVHSSAEGRYILTAEDKTTYTFYEPPNGVLERRTWPNGETWQFTYSNGLLSSVNDGHNRLLYFSYITTSGFSLNKLWRVTDHTGRLVEFSYIQDPVDGKALLHTVTDVLGRVWQYHYYGHLSGQNNPLFKNYMVERLSPTWSYDGVGSGNLPAISLEAIEYTEGGGYLGSLTQARGNGLLTTNLAFQADKTTETLDGKTTTHRFAMHSGIYRGAIRPSLSSGAQQIVNKDYRPTLQLDANGNATTLAWNNTGKNLNQVTDALSNTTGFTYNTNDTLNESLDAEGRRTQYLYGDANQPRLPTAIKVLDTNGTTVLQWQTFTYDSLGRVLTERLVSPTDVNTILRETIRTYYTSGNGNGLLRSVRQHDLANQNDQTTTYIYDAYGRVIQTNQSSALGNCTRSRTIYDAAGNVVASLCNFDLDTSGTPSASSGQASSAFDEDPTTAWQSTGLTNEWLQYDFGAGNAKALTSISLLAGDTQLNEMPSAFTLVASDDGINWSAQPILSVNNEPAWNSREMRVYSFENATAYRYWRLNLQAAFSEATRFSLAELDLIPTTYPADVDQALALRASTVSPELNKLTLHDYDQLGRRVRTRVNVGTSEEMETRTVYDALNRVVRTIANFVQANAPANPYTAAHSDFSNHGLDNTENLVTDTTYNTRGLVESQTDGLGNMTRYVYDDAGRQVKVIQNYVNNGVDPALWVWNNNQWQNGSGVAIAHGTNNDQNLISASEYDANGNLVKTRDGLGNVSFTIYDVLNRVVKTVRSAKATATINPADPNYGPTNDPRLTTYVADSTADRDLITQTVYDRMGRVIRTQDETGQWALFGYDPLGRQVRVIRNAVNSTYDLTADADLSGYGTPNPAADQDILTETVYDTQGRVDYTIDVNGSRTKLVYDGLGRQVRTVQNYQYNGTGYNVDPATWVWNGTAWQDDAATPATIPHGSNNDQNIIAVTNYDTDGRVRWTQDVLGRKTWHVYDAQGREVKTIVNCTYNGTGIAPEDPAYTGSSDSDKDVITQTIYDTFGRVSASLDARGNESRYFYDKLGRRLRSITNYVVQGSSNPANWRWDDTAGQKRWETSVADGGIPISFGTNNDQNLISEVTYDFAGRVVSTRDSAGRVTYQVYDKANRRLRTIANFVAQGTTNPADWVWDNTDKRWEYGASDNTPIDHGVYLGVPHYDLNLISDTFYNRAGQVTATRDARGTLTSFIYDAVGRRQQVIQADGSSIATRSYTVYDKGGRVLRSVRNWQPQKPDYNAAYDAKLDPATWTWNTTLARWEDDNTPPRPVPHGVLSDQNLPMQYKVDKLGRTTEVISPVGSKTVTAYSKDGRVQNTTDPDNFVTQYRYDQLRRLRRVVQAYLNVGYDPALWYWTGGNWSNSHSALVHSMVVDGVSLPNSANIIADVTLDVVGRQIALRDPNGNQTTYTYDLLNRRIGLINPAPFQAQVWATAYADLAGGESQVIATNPMTHQTEQRFDRLGRLIEINYLNESPKDTDDVRFTYDVLGNRTSMTTPPTVRQYTYDKARRLRSVPNTGYLCQYDLGGLRTAMGGDNYTYDELGRMTSLNSGAGNVRYLYDQAGRLVSMRRPNGLDSQYQYDLASRLKRIHHTNGNKVFGHFAYEMDRRGNRLKAFEAVPDPLVVSPRTYGATHAAVEYLRGTWTGTGSKVSSDPNAALRIAFFGKQVTIGLGSGTDHGICDLYVNDTFWRSYDGYVGGAITLTLATEGPHHLEIRNRADKNPNSSGYKLTFGSIQVPIVYSLHNITYTYDGLSRLRSAKYRAAANANPTTPTFRDYAYTYDRSGNRTQKVVNWTEGSSYSQTTNYTFDNANRLTQHQQVGQSTVAVTYNAAGQMTQDGTENYTWDRAGRLLTAPNARYTYNGLGQRISQETFTPPDTMSYGLDIQPALYKTLNDQDNGSVSHGPMGVQSKSDIGFTYNWMIQDGLGSVRGLIQNDLQVAQWTHFDPYGEVWDEGGPLDGDRTAFGFTGEMTDGNGLVFLRARYYNPTLGVFPSLDPMEGGASQPLSLDRYIYVLDNPANLTDPSGMIYEKPSQYGSCQSSSNPCEQFCSNGNPYPVNPPLESTEDQYRLCVFTCQSRVSQTCGEPVSMLENWTMTSPDQPFFPRGQLYYSRCGGTPRWDGVSDPVMLNEGDFIFTTALGTGKFGCTTIWPNSQIVVATPQRNSAFVTNDCYPNFEAVWNRDLYNPAIQSIGIILGGAIGISVFGIIGPSVGGSVLMMFEGNFETMNLENCHAYFGLEAGVQVGTDLGEGIYGGFVWSTSRPDKVAGVSANISYDLLLFDPIKTIEHIVSRNLNPLGFLKPGSIDGIARTLGSCDYTGFRGINLPISVPTISFTFGGTIRLGTCKHVLEHINAGIDDLKRLI